MNIENKLKVVKGASGLMPADELTILLMKSNWVIKTKQKISVELHIDGQVLTQPFI